jgi:hypothetical protein
MEGKEWTSFWHADTWGRDNRGSWTDAHVCTVTRKKEINEWCGSTETMMAYAAGPDEASKHVEEEMAARNKAAKEEQDKKEAAIEAKKAKEEAKEKKEKATTTPETTGRPSTPAPSSKAKKEDKNDN